MILPVTAYLLWYVWAKQQMRAGHDPYKYAERPWFYVVIIALVTMLGCFGVLIFDSTRNKGEHYTPAEYINGKVVPAKIE